MGQQDSESVDQDIEALRERYLNQDFDEQKFEVTAEKTIEYARLCGETAERFLLPEHADFQATPTYVASLSGSRSLPKGFPRFGIGMDAGKGVECFKPVIPGQTLIGRTHLHDIYTKTGRSGRMIFTVSRIEIFDEDGVHLANSDSRIVMREKAK